jgi:hypothetical protein
MLGVSGVGWSPHVVVRYARVLRDSCPLRRVARTALFAGGALKRITPPSVQLFNFSFRQSSGEVGHDDPVASSRLRLTDHHNYHVLASPRLIIPPREQPGASESLGRPTLGLKDGLGIEEVRTLEVGRSLSPLQRPRVSMMALTRDTVGASGSDSGVPCTCLK